MFKVLNFLSWYFRNAADMLWIDIVESFKESKEEGGIVVAILVAIVCIIISLVTLCSILLVILTSPVWNLILYILRLAGFSSIDNTLRQWHKYLNEILDEFEKRGLM